MIRPDKATARSGPPEKVIYLTCGNGRLLLQHIARRIGHLLCDYYNRFLDLSDVFDVLDIEV